MKEVKRILWRQCPPSIARKSMPPEVFLNFLQIIKKNLKNQFFLSKTWIILKFRFTNICLRGEVVVYILGNIKILQKWSSRNISDLVFKENYNKPRLKSSSYRSFPSRFRQVLIKIKILKIKLISYQVW